MPFASDQHPVQALAAGTVGRPRSRLEGHGGVLEPTGSSAGTGTAGLIHEYCQIATAGVRLVQRDDGGDLVQAGDFQQGFVDGAAVLTWMVSRACLAATNSARMVALSQ